LKVLDKKQIEYLKAMKNPTSTIKDVMQALCLVMYPNPSEKRKNQETLRNEVDWWQASLKLLSNPKLLDEMISLNPEALEEKLIGNLGKFLSEQQKTLDEAVVENAS
jgi:dynein heavy chain